jgi:hypothetical protein
MTPSDVSQKMVDAARKMLKLSRIAGIDYLTESDVTQALFAAIRADPERAKAIAEHVEHKRCAHCGGEAMDNLDNRDWWIQCLDCGACSKCESSEEAAWAAWDRRA